MESLPDRPSPSRPVSEVIMAWLQWFGLVRLVITVLAVLAVGAGGYWLLRPPATPVENSLPFATPTSLRVASSTGPPTGSGSGSAGRVDTAQATDATERAPTVPIIVYVAGAVVASGVYELPPGARVQQAVLAAGGMTADADADTVNLAGFLQDGDRIYVPRVGVPVPTVVTPAASSGSRSALVPPGPSGPLDLNNASVEELDQLPGVGPSTAAAIIAHRDNNGPFATVDGLLDVRGIGPAKLDAIRALITV